jgi:hypothetical protein
MRRCSYARKGEHDLKGLDARPRGTDVPRINPDKPIDAGALDYFLSSS